MTRKKLTGLYFDNRSQTYYINKCIDGERIHKATYQRTRTKAELVLTEVVEKYRLRIHEPLDITFRDAAIKHLTTTYRKDLGKDAIQLSYLLLHIGTVPLAQLDISHLTCFVQDMIENGRKRNTINSYLSLVRLILNRAVNEWKQDNGDPWLSYAPRIKMLSVNDARLPYPLSWSEQRLLFPLLPDHLSDMALLMANTGLRDQELCQLRWEWLRSLDNTDIHYFMIPANYHKNSKRHIVVLNPCALSIIKAHRAESQSGYVFTYKGKPLSRMRNDGWLHAVERASQQYKAVIGSACPPEFASLRVHDLRHTVGRRLRVAGASDMDIADVLGHSKQSLSRHYSDAEITHLYRLLSRIAKPVDSLSPTLSLIKRAG